MKRAVLVVLIAGACGGHQPPPPISSTGSGSGSASTATTASGPCGGQTCAPTDYCIETTVSGGMAPAPGDPPNISTSYSCGAPPPQSNAGRCSEPDAQRNIHCEYAAP